MLDISLWTTMAPMKAQFLKVKKRDARASVELVATGVTRMWDHPMAWSGARAGVARKSVEGNSRRHERSK
jgi:hypothetical protein